MWLSGQNHRKMKKAFISAVLMFAALSAQAQDYTQRLSIWFDTPNLFGDRDAWESQSLPIGNGSLGANIMGSVETECITFNEKTLWRGGPNTSKGAAYYWDVNKESAHVLGEIRRAFAEGDDEKAARLTRKNFNSTVPYEPYREEPFRFGNFTTMGVFHIETGIDRNGITGYRRELSLDRALASVLFEKDGTAYERDFFISYPHNVMVIRFRADRPGMQNLTFSYAPNPVATGTMNAEGSDGLVYKARLDNNSMEYVIRVRAVCEGGKVSSQDGRLRVEGADEAVFIVTADTDYLINFDPDFNDPRTYVGVDPSLTTAEWMERAEELGYDGLYEAHYKDYSTLFDRVSLKLNGGGKGDDIPTPQRLENYREGQQDHYLEELYYQFGRYLLIASSRPGNLPANLQGIWHNSVDGPWRVDYHNNINVQMNYWPAGPTNLAECTLPLIDFIRTLVKPGERTARSYFGARGWTASISGNIFGFTSPLESEDMSWNFNPMAGPWLATHIWEYYEYTQDREFLEETGYDLIRSSADFAVDYLWKRPDGTYTAAPSTSPEHGPVDEGATFVHAVIREILTDAIEASEVLGVDRKDRRRWEEVLKKLVPYRIGRYGQLMEWSKDIDDPNDDHRHVNHLFGLHPGHTISPVSTPDLAQASRIVLEHRGDGATGWSMGWKLNQWARLHDGNRAYKLYGNLLKNGTLDNLWDTHPPFQIDGNFGGTAGVTEMLMQSHMGFIHLLPALPDAWKDSGEVKGLCARGNYEVDICWEDGEMKQVRILSKSGGTCEVRYRDSVIRLKTVKGKVYSLTYDGTAIRSEMAGRSRP